MSVRQIHESVVDFYCKDGHLTFQVWVDCGPEFGWVMQVECYRCGHCEVWDDA